MFYQLIMAVIYLPAYNTFRDNLDDLHISIVNKDTSKSGKTLVNQLEDTYNKQKKCS
ncbi:hypothetical protein [Lactobacillus terrae]|uniref:hypothetical protein n=1 Tax=Lactobacillus terrae TaxID=2269374 RepID=UPI0014747CFB|nr:hypothetical protein [Lactobacillus terrae]